MALVNTAAGPRHEDLLVEPRQLRELLLAFDEPEPVEVDDVDLADARAARTHLAEVFAVAGDEPRLAERLNGLLARTARPRLVGHGATPLHLHVDEPDATWGGWLLASGAFALALMIGEYGVDVLGRCAASECDHAVLRCGPGQTRRFCGSACASRTRVAAHRAARADRPR